MQGEAVLDRVDAGFEGEPDTVQALRMGGDSFSHPVRLVDDGARLRRCHLGRLRVLEHDGPGSGRHDLDVVRSASQLLAHSFSHLIGSVGLPVHAAENVTSGRGGGDDPAAMQDAWTRGQAGVDSLAQMGLLVVVAAHVAHRGDAGAEQVARRFCQREVAQLPRHGRLSSTCRRQTKCLGI